MSHRNKRSFNAVGSDKEVFWGGRQRDVGGRQGGRLAAEAGGKRLQPLPQQVRPAFIFLPHPGCACLASTSSSTASSVGSCSGSQASCCLLPGIFCLTDVFYLDFRGVIVVAQWECGRGLALGLSPVTGSLACVFFSPLFVIQIMSVSAVYLDILGG